MPARLFMVATPIGNLGDMTARALETLRQVDVIACEDTRRTAKLLTAFKISKPMLCLHERSSDSSLSKVMSQLSQGKNVAYMTDAGTPGLNDPGGKLAAQAFNQGYFVTPIPGASAITAAISVCGFPMDEFAYMGFPPHKKGRQTFFKTLAERNEACIFLESPHRALKALESLHSFLSADRLVFVGRELTKFHETMYRGTPETIRQTLETRTTKGEFIFIIAPSWYKD